MSGDAVSAPLEQSKKPAGDGPTVFAHACKLGLEGIVSKRKDSPLFFYSHVYRQR